MQLSVSIQQVKKFLKRNEKLIKTRYTKTEIFSLHVDDILDLMIDLLRNGS